MVQPRLITGFSIAVRYSYDLFYVLAEMEPEVAMTKSNAAGGLCGWVRAIEAYSVVAKQVAPKKKKLDEMNTRLNEMKARLKEKQDQLQEVE
jgi:dynein heavy chain